jgi:hypothetical protein
MPYFFQIRNFNLLAIILGPLSGPESYIGIIHSEHYEDERHKFDMYFLKKISDAFVLNKL